MRISRVLSIPACALALCFLFSPGPALALDQVTLYCQSSSTSLRLIRRALKIQVLNSIPSGEFSNVRVGVRTRKRFVQPPSYSYAVSDLLQNRGLTVSRQDQEGLEFNVAGTWEVTESDQCIFGYNVYITVYARRVSNGERLRYTTTSRIDINEALNGRIRFS